MKNSRLNVSNKKFLAKDKYGQLVFLADSDFTIDDAKQIPDSEIIFYSEFSNEY
jgi:peptide chain release factor 3